TNFLAFPKPTLNTDNKKHRAFTPLTKKLINSKLPRKTCFSLCWADDVSRLFNIKENAKD
ncbi:hypothetical protein COV18_05230, partial [Candidatus Woesearchaeota archaeon CG10_big_fil_rev_8_21_14_0_10_37_12]